MSISTEESKFMSIASRGKWFPPKGELNLFFGPRSLYLIRSSNGGKYELKKILEAQRDENDEWNLLCEWRGFDSSQTTGNQPIRLFMDTRKGSLTSSRSTPKLVYS